MHFGLSYNLFGFDLGGVHLSFDEIDPSQGINKWSSCDIACDYLLGYGHGGLHVNSNEIIP